MNLITIIGLIIIAISVILAIGAVIMLCSQKDNNV